jgi:NADH dehydrogenase
LTDLLTKEETFFQSDLVIFTAGGEPSALVKDLDLLKDQSSQRILVKNTLQTMQYPNIFAIGDCSLIEGQPYPATAQVAFQQSVVVTTNLLQLIKMELTGQPNKPGAMTEFKYLSLGEMISLGDFNASVSFLNGWIGLRGPFASIGRRLLYIYRMPTWSQSFYAALVAIKSSGIKLIRSSLPSAPYSSPLH